MTVAKDPQIDKRLATSVKQYTKSTSVSIPNNIGFIATSDGSVTIKARLPAPGDASAENAVIPVKAGQYIPIDVEEFSDGEGNIYVLFFTDYYSPVP